MIVRLTRGAERDLENIADHVAADKVERAITLLGGLREHCLALAERPERFPLVPRYGHHGIRRRVHGRCLIFYRVEPGQVVVLHVLHGARDYEPLLFPDEG